MKRLITLIVLIVALALTIVLVFWLGQRSGSRTVNEQILSNSLIVKEIAELATLEVQGTTSHKASNISNDAGWFNNMRRVFAENTVWITVPYTAKFGVDVNEQNFHIEVTDSLVLISLPAPQLLSYELRLDQMETASRKGWLMFANDETYTDAQKKMYTVSRQQMVEKSIYSEQSKDKIRKVMAQYYAPFKRTVKVKFGNEEAQTIKLD